MTAKLFECAAPKFMNFAKFVIIRKAFAIDILNYQTCSTHVFALGPT